MANIIGAWLAVPIVSGECREVCMVLIEQKMQWVVGDKERNQEATKVEQVLHRMHCQRRPGSWVVALVVERMHPSVEERANVAIHNPLPPVEPGVHGAVHCEGV